ncbi:hypothetical protein FQN57_001214 [Myotisia sp. PD_48]|nr:hypothetical protein FQN57_001214 [Myotisia sp. PD_48]
MWSGAAHDPREAAGFFHWPFLANVELATEMILAMGPEHFAQRLIQRWRGDSSTAIASLESDDAMEMYKRPFRQLESVVRATCLDYQAGASVDVDAQREDQKAGRKIEVPTLVLYSRGLGKRYNVPNEWEGWVAQKQLLKTFELGPGVGHFVAEEDPEGTFSASRMRRGLVVFIVVNLVVIALLVRSVFTLITLLLEDASDDALSRAELFPNSTLDVPQVQLIPKIIHQTYKNESIPAMWQQAQQSCIDHHPDYQYILWTDEKSEEFIAKQYPDFLETFQNYPYPIQRADAIRYFVLAHYGGVYLDLDDGCNRRLDPLLAFPAWLRRTAPTGISNDAMGSIPQHPFFLRVIDSLNAYNRSWVLPYITIMYSTGPLFLSVMWKEYKNQKPTGADRVRVLLQDAYNKHSWSFFTHHPGSSWHGKDARLIFWMGGHWMLLTASGFLLAGLVGLCLWSSYRRVLSFTAKHYHRYTPLSPRSRDVSPASRSYSPSRRKFLTFFQRPHSKKVDEENITKTIYELTRRSS